jgi:cobalt-zinc-cadmium efflux system outer membrane protein
MDMQAFAQRISLGLLLGAAFATGTLAQQALTWQEIRDRFEKSNPTLLAGQLGIEESKASEITAYLRPNPSLSLIADQINPFNGGPPHSTFGTLLTVASV